MNCQFTFGPNRTYFCSADSFFAWSEGNLPSSLQRILDDPRHPQAMATPYDVAFPMESDSYGMCWRTSRGELCNATRLPPHYSRLTRFLESSTAAFSVNTTRTVFGPNKSFFSMSPRGYAWQNLPHSLEEELQTSLRARRPTTVALGANGAYVVLFNDGTVNFDLRGVYPLVDAIIRDTAEAGRRKGVMYISLNPHIPGEFYLVFGDASAKWNFPSGWSADVITVSREIKPIETSSPPASVMNVSMGGTTPRSSSVNVNVPMSPRSISSSMSPRPISPAPSILSSVHSNSSNGTSSSHGYTPAMTSSSLVHGYIPATTSSSLAHGYTPATTTLSGPDTDAPPAYAPIASRPSSPTSIQSPSLSFAALHDELDHLHLYNGAGSSSLALPPPHAAQTPNRPHSHAFGSPSLAYPASASSSASSSSPPTSVHSAPAAAAWPGDVKSSAGPGADNMSMGRFRVANPSNPSEYSAGAGAGTSAGGVFDARQLYASRASGGGGNGSGG
ncbi:hypothetical protein C8F01DRAFT_1130935 [Mycena amicta]|nr:hypothetical protein C8F01DRAFT_1130935 [Mycena amicta]